MTLTGGCGAASWGHRLFIPFYLKIPTTWLSPVKLSYIFSTHMHACNSKDVSVSGRMCSRQARVDVHGGGSGQEGVAIVGTGILTCKVFIFL